jgi:CRISPR/Cas system CSM-associated protein Csm4 (group 5 of RAMP superfamily)
MTKKRCFAARKFAKIETLGFNGNFKEGLQAASLTLSQFTPNKEELSQILKRRKKERKHRNGN